MRNLVLAILSLAVAQPALAQYREPFGSPYPDRYRNASPRQLLEQLDRRIEHDFRFGIIDRIDWQRLRTDADRLRRVDFEYGHDGFSNWERSNLALQIDRLREDVLAAEQRRFGRSVIVPRPDPYSGGRDYRREDDDAWNDRDYDRDRLNDDYFNDEPSDRYGGAVGNDARADIASDSAALDRDENAPDDTVYEPGGGYPEELRIGDPAPVNLGLLPPDLRGRFRDGNGVYYRYWNGTVYQVDDETNVIRWIGPARN